MLLGKYHISPHALEQYSDRCNYSGSAKQAIKRDLRTLNIKNIFRTPEKIHIFTKQYKEFIFVKTGSSLCLKTVIKRNYDDTQKVIEKMKALAN